MESSAAPGTGTGAVFAPVRIRKGQAQRTLDGRTRGQPGALQKGSTPFAELRSAPAGVQGTGFPGGVLGQRPKVLPRRATDNDMRNRSL